MKSRVLFAFVAAAVFSQSVDNGRIYAQDIPTATLNRLATANPSEHSTDDAEAIVAKDESASTNIAAEPGPEASFQKWMIGLQCVAADKLLRGHLKLGDSGLVVQHVIDASPAAAGGLQKDDLLLRVSGKQLTEVSDLMGHIQSFNGTPLEIEILRHGDPLKVTVVPRERTSMGLHQEGSRLREFHPGIIIDRSSNPEDTHIILEQALKAAGIDPSVSLQPAGSSENTFIQQLPDQLEELRLEVQRLAARVAALEQTRHAAKPAAHNVPGD